MVILLGQGHRASTSQIVPAQADITRPPDNTLTALLKDPG
jgi:hypothetical protein